MSTKKHSELWQRLKAARLHAKLTQQQVADALGVSAPAVTQWEARSPERRTTPDLAHLKKFSALTHAPLDWLMDDTAEIGSDWFERINEPTNLYRIAPQPTRLMSDLDQWEVTDDRMSPTIKIGDTVTCDPRQCDLAHGKIYAIGPNKTLARVTINLDGSAVAAFDSEPGAFYPFDRDDVVCRVTSRSGPL